MGEAFSAVVDDAGAMYWNPAALSQFQGNQFILGGTYLGITMELQNAVGTRAPNFQPSQRSISGAAVADPQLSELKILNKMLESGTLTVSIKAG